MSYPALLLLITVIICSHALIGIAGFLLGRRMGMLDEHRESEIQTEVLEFVAEEALSTLDDADLESAKSRPAAGSDSLDRD